jgi:tetraacyldisaccharide 4'-kinase
LLDLLYGAAVGARRRWYERHPEARRHLKQPVISIGNLSVGGTGKTPLVSLVAEWLLARGERPAILSRGYGRSVRDVGAIVVCDGERLVADLDRAGDEPLMLARARPRAIVVASEDRHLAGVLAERRLGATVHILDDGFQHLSLARDIDVLVTSAGEIPGGRVLPFGRLREAAGAAARAHVVVVVGADEDAARGEAWSLGVSQWVAARRVVEKPGTTSVVLAVAGIGDPDQFFATLRDAGWNVARTLSYSDHHRYNARDISAIADAARSAGAELVVTTEKDAVRLDTLGTLPFTRRAVPMTLELSPKETLFETIDAALSRAREKAGHAEASARRRA